MCNSNLRPTFSEGGKGNPAGKPAEAPGMSPGGSTVSPQLLCAARALGPPRPQVLRKAPEKQLEVQWSILGWAAFPEG